MVGRAVGSEVLTWAPTSPSSSRWTLITLAVGLLGAWISRLQDAERGAYREPRLRRGVPPHLPAASGRPSAVRRARPGQPRAADARAGPGREAPFDRGAVYVRSGGSRLSPVTFLGADRLDWDVDHPLFDEAWASSTAMRSSQALTRATSRRTCGPPAADRPAHLRSRRHRTRLRRRVRAGAAGGRARACSRSWRCGWRRRCSSARYAAWPRPRSGAGWPARSTTGSPRSSPRWATSWTTSPPGPATCPTSRRTCKTLRVGAHPRHHRAAAVDLRPAQRGADHHRARHGAVGLRPPGRRRAPTSPCTWSWTRRRSGCRSTPRPSCCASRRRPSPTRASTPTRRTCGSPAGSTRRAAYLRRRGRRLRPRPAAGGQLRARGHARARQPDRRPARRREPRRRRHAGGGDAR